MGVPPATCSDDSPPRRSTPPTPFGTLVGGPGLDARQFTDLSAIQRDRLITPSDEVFVRTAAPAALEPPLPSWAIRVDGFRSAEALTVAALLERARPMGPHLIECSGNTDPDNFGLMSVAEWDGVPLVDILERQGLPAAARRGRRERRGRSRVVALVGRRREWSSPSTRCGRVARFSPSG